MIQFDDHYRDLEPIEIIEKNAQRMASLGVDPRSIIAVGNALKYLLRCGSKRGEPFEKDLQKALNYTFRAINHRWEWEKKENDGNQNQ